MSTREGTKGRGAIWLATILLLVGGVACTPDVAGTHDAGDRSETATGDPDTPPGVSLDGGAPVPGHDTRSDAGGSCKTGGFGCLCEGPADCGSGVCVLHLGDGVCTRPCDADCPSGWTCAPLDGGDDGSVCLSLQPTLCLPCASDEDCRDDGPNPAACVPFGDDRGSFCAGPCEADANCPAGFVCAARDDEDAAGGRTCRPADGECPCGVAAIAAARTTPCWRENEHGRCAGERACTVAGLTECTAPSPAAEICFNGIDDDCDGVTDPGEACRPCRCGDGQCEPDRCGEDWQPGAWTCAVDCAVCGNGTCDAGEGTEACPIDCCGTCGDGHCKGGDCGENPTSCPADCETRICGDGFCGPGESAVECPPDCVRYVCGNRTCEPGEDAVSCPHDCGTTCGDCSCDGGETYETCPTDCGYCGDGYCIANCSHLVAEDGSTCVRDCCQPRCEGRECGDDGCGGFCGLCPGHDPCLAACHDGRCGPLHDEETACNGADDDCDGQTDEGFLWNDPESGAAKSLGAPCGRDVCAGGVVVCRHDGSGLACSTEGGEGGERCDGLDNDCDGLTDADDPDDLRSTDPTVCEADRGACAGAYKPPRLCRLGEWQPCDAEVYEGHSDVFEADVEQTCDGLDNDCDGQTDEDFLLELPEGVVADAVGTPCGRGLCAGGVVLCREDGAGLACSTAAYLRPERCNGIDDDCDGRTDADDAADLAAGDPRACERAVGVCAGAVHPPEGCVAGAWEPCSADVYAARSPFYEPLVEVHCDGRDNDCDGATDEDFGLLAPDGSHVEGAGRPCGVGACAGGVSACDEGGAGIVCTTADSAAPETCNGVDDDCDGRTDAADLDDVVGGYLRAESVPCEEGRGVCAGAHKPARLCQGGQWSPCDDAAYSGHAPLFEPRVETVCDGWDNDCDGQTDEDFPLTLPDGSLVVGAGVPCGTGVCQNGITSCAPDRLGVVCGSLAVATAEVCNGIDDDCDGQTDEGFTWSDPPSGPARSPGEACGVGACAGGVVECAAEGDRAVCSTAGLATAERCDGQDNDCDGLTDAGAPEALAAGDHPPCERQDGVCAGATKPPTLCRDAAWLPCDAAAYLAHDPGHEPLEETSCDGRDNDCDGATDEDFLFVQRDGVVVAGAETPCGAGACAGGVTSCRADGAGIECPGESLASAERCNGLDDDCDGGTDADDADDLAGDYLLSDQPPCGLQAGVCEGVVRPASLCVGGRWLPCGPEEYAPHADTWEPSPETRCDGLDNDCDGATDDVFWLFLRDGTPVSGAGTPCGTGACAGGRTTCAVDGAGIVCDGESAATPETCNGIDDDCDGRTDAADRDDIVAGYFAIEAPLCQEQRGVCGGTLRPAALCAGGQWQPCTAVEFAVHDVRYDDGRERRCDGVDNDCDGDTDEDFTVVMPDGITTSGVQQPCGSGACGGGTTSCTPDGTGVACSTAGLAAPETCNGLDDDCDGATDAADTADLERDDPQLCEEQRGVCDGSTKPAERCQDGHWLPCVPDTYVAQVPGFSEGAESACDGLDDDCDGETDEDFVLTMPDGTVHVRVGEACGRGTCAGGSVVCRADGGGLTCSTSDLAAIERCNGRDDDCDGLTDGADEADLLAADPRHCESQAGVCAGAEKPVSLCADGQWAPCDEATYAAWNPAYGNGAELVCDGLDNNCDGATDEGFAWVQRNGIVVTGSGRACGVGACAGGTTECLPDGLGIVCPFESRASAEVCNGVDDDCDGGADAADPDDVVDGRLVHDAPLCERQDGPCAGVTRPAIRCGAAGWGPCLPDDYAAYSADFDGFAEIRCDGRDNDCNGVTDDGFDIPLLDGTSVDRPGVPCGRGVCAGGETVCRPDGLGIECPGEAAAGVEVCNGLDDDCDGLTDADDPSLVRPSCEQQLGICEGSRKPARLCEGGQWASCDALAYGTHDGRYEAGGETRCDGVDNDCDDVTDADCDRDGDDWCDIQRTVVGTPAVCPNGGGDCADLDPTINPGALEVCDDVDNDCLLGPDDGCDDDDDGWCDAAKLVVGTPATCPSGGGDCDDDSPAIRPDAIDVCDGLDNDCALPIDPDCDRDGDGWCDAGRTVVGLPPVCPRGGGDCADLDPDVHPQAAERCNGVDDDCAEGIDDGCDDDGDAFCDVGREVAGPPWPAVCSAGPGDCDDRNGLVHPGAVEACNDEDDNCADGPDEGCDDDGDDWCDVALAVAGPPWPAVCPNGPGDCDDGRALSLPGGVETCNGHDDDCDDATDEGCDDDDDDRCDAAMVFEPPCPTCPQGGGDCDDENPGVHPAVAERCDGVDNNCGGLDEGCDDDGDDWCDPDMTVAGPPWPDVCPNGPGDCCDSDARAKPSGDIQTTVSACGTWDFDCDGSVERFFTRTFSACAIDLSGQTVWCGGDGWSGSVPACGVRAAYTVCPNPPMGGQCSAPVGSTRVQACR